MVIFLLNIPPLSGGHTKKQCFVFMESQGQNQNQHIETPPKYSRLNTEEPINEVELEFEDTQTNLLKEA